MMYNDFILLAIACIVVVGMRYLYHKIQALRNLLNYLKETREHYTIVVIKPSVIPAIAEVIRPFIAHMKKYASFEFETVDCVHNLNRDKAQEWVNYAIDCKADLILAIGLLSSEVAFNAMKMHHKKIPIISAGSPMGYNVTPFEAMQATTPLTAVCSKMNWERNIALMNRVNPRVKTVLIIYRSVDEISHNNLKEKNAITAALRKMHISWRMHHVPNIDKSTELNTHLLETIDMIVLSRSSEILRYSSRIAREAQQFNVPVFSPDISCPDVFIGITECPERAMGIQSAKYAIEILEDKVSASTLPLKEISSDTMVVIHPQTASPITAAMVIGNFLTQSNHVALSLITPNNVVEKK